MPFAIIPVDTSMRLQVAEAYQTVGAPDRAVSITRSTEPLALNDLDTAADERQLARALQAVGALRSVYRGAGADAARFWAAAWRCSVVTVAG